MVPHNKLVSSNASESEKAYLGLLDDRLSALARRTGATLESLINGALGAFPTLVVQRLHTLGLVQSIQKEPEQSKTPESSFEGPELHPLDFEWYFTPKSANDLAEILSNEIGDVLCLSAPTAATSIARRGKKVFLLDRNPLIRYRLSRGLTSLQFFVSDILNPLPVTTRFPVVFFDAPWYPDFLSLWLWKASQIVQLEGLLGFALFRPLLRPGAKHERSQILEKASIFGDVEIQEGILSYETPLFEQEALARCGIRLKGSWRRGDLVLVRVDKIPRSRPPIIRNLKKQWDTFLLDRQVVKLSRSSRYEGSFVIAPLEDCPDYVFPTVSSRDPRIDQIDLWTSRNRVARVGQRDIISVILDYLSRGLDLDQLMESSVLSSVSIDDRKQLISNLASILMLPLKEVKKCQLL